MLREKGRRGEKENIDQSTLLNELVLDFAHFAPFITAGDSKRTVTENVGQISDFSPSA